MMFFKKILLSRRAKSARRPLLQLRWKRDKINFIFFVLAFLSGDAFLQSLPSLPSFSSFSSFSWIHSIHRIYSLSSFQSITQLFYIIFIILLLLIIIKKNRYFIFSLTLVLIAFSLGFIYSLHHAQSILSWSVNRSYESKPITIIGYIDSLPIQGKFGVNFDFYLKKLIYENVNTLSNTNISESPNTLIKLTASNLTTTQLQPGDYWKFSVRLKRIHGIQSPGAFDYQAWAMQKGLRATGTVITGSPLLNTSSADNSNLNLNFNPKININIKNYFNKLRFSIRKKFDLYGPHTAVSPWLLALIIGERNGIPQSDWQVLRNTGTNHLMAIGGLHIGIISGFAFIIFSWLWRNLTRVRFLPSPILTKLQLKFPAQHVAATASLLTAILYSSLSGFAIPTQRASIMLFIFIMATLSYRKINPWNAWSFALLFSLLINPSCILSESFWLSFGTIALILYGMSNRLAPSGIWWKWVRVQWVIGLGLIPLSLIFFQECSVVSVIANSIAIPWLAFTILPLCFISTLLFIFSSLFSYIFTLMLTIIHVKLDTVLTFTFISSIHLILNKFASCLLSLADKSLSLLWSFLLWIASLKYSSIHLAVIHLDMPNTFIFMAMIFGVTILLLPAGFSIRYLGIIFLLPIFLYQPDKPLDGEYWLSVLDVGQGLSVIVQTSNHLLVYDTGPKFYASLDMGENVVLPYLRKLHAKKINELVISHGDNDHAGGAKALLNAFPYTHVYTSAQEKIFSLTSFSSDYCKAGLAWEWDHVKFRFLYPFIKNLNLNNDSSCVLLIENNKHRVLLPGDIEKYAERELLNSISSSQELNAGIIIAPHHGSKTSGLKNFIKAVSPQYVIYATGYKNRYHFPHPSVVAAYEDIHAQAFNTVDTGTIIFKLDNTENNRKNNDAEYVKNNNTETKNMINFPEQYRITHKKYWYSDSR